MFMNVLLLQMFATLFNMGNIYWGWQESFVSINELIKFYSEKPKIVEKQDAKELDFSTPSIKFLNVNFNYFNS